jgi:hypothetical protein
VEQSQGVLQTQLRLLKSKWLVEAKNDSKALKLKKAGKINEYSAAVVTQFLGISQPSIKSCTNNLDTVEKKLAGVEINAHDCSSKLNRVLDKQEELKTEFMAAVNKRLGKHASPKAPEQAERIEKQLDEYLQPNFDKVQDLIVEIGEEVKRIRAADQLTTKLQREIKALASLRGKGVEVLENVLLFTDIAMTPMSGNSNVTTWTSFGQNLAAPLASLAIDRISNKALAGTWLA